MPISDYPRLCGGVFLSYLLDARKQRYGVREHYNGDSDGLSDPEAFAALIRVISPSYTVPGGNTFKENTSSYKNCRKNAGTHLPLNGTAEARTFDECVRTDYQTALSRMLAFTSKYLDTGTETKKDEYLVEALIEVIAKDDSIEPNADFYALKNGITVSKAVLTTSTDFCLQAFLIGIWHFILQNRPGNTVGRSTIEGWKPTAGFTQKLSVSDCPARTDTSSHIEDTASEYAETVVDDTAEESSDSSKQSTTQTVNNPVVFNQYGNNGIQIGSIGTLNIKHGD